MPDRHSSPTKTKKYEKKNPRKHVMTVSQDL